MTDPVLDPAIHGVDVATDLGQEKALDAVVGPDDEGVTGEIIPDRRVRIKSVSFGDANGVPYDPDPSQTALVNERIRVEVSKQLRIGPKSFLVKATVPPEAEVVAIREMAFNDEDGDPIFIWAGSQLTRFSHTGVHEYNLEHTLNMAGFRAGVIIVDAPLDELEAFMLTSLANDALAFHQIFQLQRGAAQ